jgi:hypothetical protein
LLQSRPKAQRLCDKRLCIHFSPVALGGDQLILTWNEWLKGEFFLLEVSRFSFLLSIEDRMDWIDSFISYYFIYYFQCFLSVSALIQPLLGGLNQIFDED